ncbi:BON domain-containing protein [Paraburkholderia bonniea]|uniref:BON domain-containing protein n=1 Tax=Paraburkholderia bonniea TaxID=2152891 RepID=UPI0012910A5E|nr:BON domain-containing protein [Paraburkholderia bonniea]WJF90206.1 BON domain-containing protein [Paraburkholderia bonniea]WJF93520.1 BON domain-containing protein [Paraburkholderia bonniea]
MSPYRFKTTIVRTTLMVGLASGLAMTLQGCVLAVAGAAAGGSALVATDRRTLGAQTEDREIQVKAMSTLSTNLPDAAHINVSVFNRRVLLTGEVPDDAAKQKAEALVRVINNVNAIINELTTGPASTFSSRTNDTYLEGRIKTALIAEKNITTNNYKIVCERGSAYMMGLVTVDEGNRGADVVSRVPGVVQVVKVFQYIKPQEAAAISAATATSASATDASSAPSDEVTVNAVPEASVSTRSIEQQPPAPVTNSNPVQPGNAAAPR